MEQVRIRCAIMRGGTSKAVFLLRNELPSDRDMRDKVVRAIFGSPDIRQIDGLGGAEPLTSKCAVIGAPSREGHDCDYLFGQVDIATPKIMWFAVCGNISAGVGPFAIDEGFVDAKEPITTVKINCVGLKPPRTLIAEVPVIDGKAKVIGDYQIDGVPGTGAKIGLDWTGLAGGTTGKLLPTGNVKDTLDVEGLGKIEVSIVDQPMPVVYCRAKDLGIKGTEGPKEFDSNEKLLQALYAIEAASRKLVNAEECFADVVAEPADYTDHITGRLVKAEEADFLSRFLFMGKLHKAHPGSGTANCGVAARIPGGIINEMLSEDAKGRLELRIGHPAGIIACESQVETGGAEMQVKRDLVFRTSRRIMDGYVYVPGSIYGV